MTCLSIVFPLASGLNGSSLESKDIFFTTYFFILHNICFIIHIELPFLVLLMEQLFMAVNFGYLQVMMEMLG
jgi:hypothetical protein